MAYDMTKEKPNVLQNIMIIAFALIPVLFVGLLLFLSMQACTLKPTKEIRMIDYPLAGTALPFTCENSGALVGEICCTANDSGCKIVLCKHEDSDYGIVSTICE